MKYLIDFIALAALYIFVLFKKWRRKGRVILIARSLMYAYLACVLLVTLMPIITSLPFIFNHPYGHPNTVPFADVLSDRGDFIRQIVLNIVMTLPFGFLFPLTKKPAAGFLRTVSACFLMSLCIEILQPLIDGFRSSDVTDLITNTLGGALGYLLYLLFKPLTSLIIRNIEKK